jgi:pectate lyase
LVIRVWGVKQRFFGFRTILLATAAVLVASGVTPASTAPQLAAFPGAEGFGAGTTGGRGGSVIIVTTLEPFGPGSLGEALAPEVCEPRIIVFEVSGVIEVPGRHDLELACGDVTIAGQTAPGAGITVHGRLDAYGADPSGNIIIRHVRFRPPPITDEEGADDDLGSIYDAFQLSNNSRVILDHVTVSWGSDEVLDLYEFASDFTVQWSTIEVSNTEGQLEPHNVGLIAGPDSPRVSIHHVLFAHHRSRCPALSAGQAEFINSVVYDCQDGFVHHNPAEGEFHLVGNTFIQGPSHENFTPLYFDDEEPGGTTYWLFQNDIRAPGTFEGVVDDIAGTPLAESAFVGAGADQVIASPSDFAAESGDYVPISMQRPDEAYAAVLERAGAFPRDAITLQTVQDVRDGTGAWGAEEPMDLLDGLSAAAPPVDDDRDGMADDWERANGLDPDDPGDHRKTMASGYTAIEEYVNQLADALVGGPPPLASLDVPSSAGEPEPPPPRQVSGADENQAPGNVADDSDIALPIAVAAMAVSLLALGLAAYAVFLLRRTQSRPPGPP